MIKLSKNVYPIRPLDEAEKLPIDTFLEKCREVGTANVDLFLNHQIDAKIDYQTIVVVDFSFLYRGHDTAIEETVDKFARLRLSTTDTQFQDPNSGYSGPENPWTELIAQACGRAHHCAENGFNAHLYASLRPTDPEHKLIYVATPEALPGLPPTDELLAFLV